MKYTLTIQDKAIFYLNKILNIAPSKIKHIIETLNDVSVIFSQDFKPNTLSKILQDSELAELSHIDMELIEKKLSKLQKDDIDVITILSDIYPANLKEIPSAPIVLYAKGNLELLGESNNLAVVGTRRCTNYGREITQSFTRTIASAGVCIVSGLADGIDAVAHKSALEVNGKTIAVIGSGFNHIYPSSNIGLAKDILNKGGLILTEYDPDEKPQAYHFPARNRIVAGLSLGVLIIEAPLKSGALITKEFALEFNREIFVVPGRITDIYSKGSNELIKSCQSLMVLSADNVLEFFGKTSDGKIEKKDIQLSMEESLILDLIKVDDKHYEKILIESGLTPFQLNSVLMKLEIKNIIKKLPGNIYTSIKI